MILIALMLVVYFTGSVESPLLLFFVIHMIVGSLILPGFVIYAFAIVIVLAFWGITVGEYYSIDISSSCIRFSTIFTSSAI
ncbi:MAG: hypothetical protein MZV64_51350 [Ignavibacteriales bacterium]|nr:hypothetical protein [Ignavibacteriales bacterium]